ncbi:MAG: S46 family peptidase [Acidobacteriota bacterium]|nr:S46 family peptidase [Acidobacteriota bacterium]
MKAKIVLTSLALAVCGMADEGMWLLDRFPREQVEKKYHFQVTDDFLRHLQLSSVRFNNGGSGSFVSPHGLLFTNHHVGADCIQKLSTAEHDYMAGGFQSATQADEKACPDLEVNVLLSTEDVTSRVNTGIKADAAPAEANRARRAAVTRIEEECTHSTGNRCDVVALYSGGQYGLYRYKKYTDVRLVFAPEYSIAAFGGDPDNFTYPRYCLDFSLFRAYENGKPIDSKEFLVWSKKGVRDGELTFVPGNPGATGRLQTVAQLEFSRDVSYPIALDILKEKVDTLLAFARLSAENKRLAEEPLQGFQNSFKAIDGFERGLRDPVLMNRKREDERRMRAAIADDPSKQAQFGKLWDEVAGAYAAYTALYKPYYFFEVSPSTIDLLVTARRVVRYAEEKTKPSQERLRGYQDAGLPSFEQQMYSTAPVNAALNAALLTDYFRDLIKYVGAGDPTVKSILVGRTPEKAAGDYVAGTKLEDVAERKRLAGSVDAVKKSEDSMIRLALLLDGPARKYRKEYEDKVDAVLSSSASRIAQARFAVYGANEYPDATFTLRLAYGPVRGYTDAQGHKMPYTTRFGGVFKRATGTEPYQLPARWLKARAALDLNTPFNFVTTADTHGGNSGSPTVDTKGEIIGILFDGNLEGLPNRYLYTEEQARSLHVASNAVIESLKKVYHADRILSELGFEPPAGTR